MKDTENIDMDDILKDNSTPRNIEEKKTSKPTEGLRSSSARKLRTSASGANLRERSNSGRRILASSAMKPPKASPMKTAGMPDSKNNEMSKNEMV